MARTATVLTEGQPASSSGSAPSTQALRADSLQDGNQQQQQQQQQQQHDEQAGKPPEAVDSPPPRGFDALPPVPFLLLRVSAPEPPAPLGLREPHAQLRETLAALQTEAAGLFSGQAGGGSGDGSLDGGTGQGAQQQQQRQQHRQQQQQQRSEGVAPPLDFLRVPLAARHAVALPQRGGGLTGALSGSGDEGGAAWDGGAPAAVQEQHAREWRVPGAAALTAGAAVGGHRGPPARSTMSMATSVTGATSHGSMLSDAQSPNAQLVSRLRRLKLLQQQAQQLFA